MRLAATLPIAALFALVACAVPAPRANLTEPLLTLDDQPSECAPSPLPRRLPAAARLLDTVGLRRELSGVLDREGADELAVTMWFRSGVLDLVTVTDRAADTALIRSLYDMLRPVVRPEEPDEWTVRLKVSPDGEVAVERSQFCPPAPRRMAPSAVRVPFVVEGTEGDVREMDRAGPFRIRVLVDASGHTANVQITQSSGNETMDRSMLDLARNFQFDPATVDGVPVPGWYVMVGTTTRIP